MVIKGVSYNAVVLFITQLTTAITKDKCFSVLETSVANWWSLDFHVSETRLHILTKLLHTTLNKWKYMQLKCHTNICRFKNGIAYVYAELCHI